MAWMHNNTMQHNNNDDDMSMSSEDDHSRRDNNADTASQNSNRAPGDYPSLEDEAQLLDQQERDILERYNAELLALEQEERRAEMQRHAIFVDDSSSSDESSSEDDEDVCTETIDLPRFFPMQEKDLAQTLTNLQTQFEATFRLYCEKENHSYVPLEAAATATTSCIMQECSLIAPQNEFLRFTLRGRPRTVRFARDYLRTTWLERTIYYHNWNVTQEVGRSVEVRDVSTPLGVHLVRVFQNSLDQSVGLAVEPKLDVHAILRPVLQSAAYAILVQTNGQPMTGTHDFQRVKGTASTIDSLEFKCLDKQHSASPYLWDTRRIEKERNGTLPAPEAIQVDDGVASPNNVVAVKSIGGDDMDVDDAPMDDGTTQDQPDASNPLAADAAKVEHSPRNDAVVAQKPKTVTTPELQVGASPDDQSHFRHFRSKLVSLCNEEYGKTGFLRGTYALMWKQHRLRFGERCPINCQCAYAVPFLAQGVEEAHKDKIIAKTYIPSGLLGSFAATMMPHIRQWYPGRNALQHLHQLLPLWRFHSYTIGKTCHEGCPCQTSLDRFRDFDYQPLKKDTNAVVNYSRSHFEFKCNDVIKAEFGDDIDCKVILPRWWKQHQKVFGDFCNEQCLCASSIPHLLTQLLESIQNDPKAPNLPSRTSSMATVFFQRFIPKLKAEYPTESPACLLGRLLEMWNVHKLHLRFGKVCSPTCKCEEGWESHFEKGLRLESAVDAQTKASFANPEPPAANETAPQTPSPTVADSSTVNTKKRKETPEPTSPVDLLDDQDNASTDDTPTAKKRKVGSAAELPDRPHVPAAESAGAAPSPETQEKTAASSQNETVRGWEVFKKKMMPVVSAEYGDSGIHSNAILSPMWKRHKGQWGHNCNSSCPCLQNMPQLTEHVAADMKKDSKWSNTEIHPVGFVATFVPRFRPLLSETFPDDSPEKQLVRLGAMWTLHTRERNFGKTCSASCACLAAWGNVFLPRLLPPESRIPRKRKSIDSLGKDGSGDNAQMSLELEAEVRGSESTEADKGPEDQDTPTATSKSTAFLGWEEFKKRLLPVVIAEYSEYEIHANAVLSHMWKRHKEIWGPECHMKCPCLHNVPHLTKNVATDLSKDPKWSHMTFQNYPVGFAGTFVPRFRPLLSKAFPDEPSGKQLERLCSMWEVHTGQRNFGKTCNDRCGCLSAWDNLFLPTMLPPESRIPKKQKSIDSLGKDASGNNARMSPELQDDLAVQQSESAEEIERRGSQEKPTTASKSKTLLGWEEFVKRMLPVVTAEYSQLGIHANAFLSHMWKRHKAIWGPDCNMKCPCLQNVPHLTNHVAADMKKDPKWSQMDIPNPVGFAGTFVPRFRQLVSETFPAETPGIHLERLCGMWAMHTRQRNFGKTCNDRCECLSAWDNLFLPRMLQPERKSQKKRTSLDLVGDDGGGGNTLFSTSTLQQLETSRRGSSGKSMAQERLPYEISFDSSKPLGMYCLTESGGSHSICKVISYNPHISGVDDRISLATTVLASKGQNTGWVAIHKHHDLKREFLKARDKNSTLTIRFINTNVTERDVRMCNKYKRSEWDHTGRWVGKCRQGWDGHLPPPLARPVDLLDPPVQDHVLQDRSDVPHRYSDQPAAVGVRFAEQIESVKWFCPDSLVSADNAFHGETNPTDDISVATFDSFESEVRNVVLHSNLEAAFSFFQSRGVVKKLQGMKPSKTKHLGNNVKQAVKNAKDVDGAIDLKHKSFKICVNAVRSLQDSKMLKSWERFHIILRRISVKSLPSGLDWGDAKAQQRKLKVEVLFQKEGEDPHSDGVCFSEMPLTPLIVYSDNEPLVPVNFNIAEPKELIFRLSLVAPSTPPEVICSASTRLGEISIKINVRFTCFVCSRKANDNQQSSATPKGTRTSHFCYEFTKGQEGGTTVAFDVEKVLEHHNKEKKRAQCVRKLNEVTGWMEQLSGQSQHLQAGVPMPRLLMYVLDASIDAECLEMAERVLNLGADTSWAQERLRKFKEGVFLRKENRKTVDDFPDESESPLTDFSDDVDCPTADLSGKFLLKLAPLLKKHKSSEGSAQLSTSRNEVGLARAHPIPEAPKSPRDTPNIHRRLSSSFDVGVTSASQPLDWKHAQLPVLDNSWLDVHLPESKFCKFAPQCNRRFSCDYVHRVRNRLIPKPRSELPECPQVDEREFQDCLHVKYRVIEGQEFWTARYYRNPRINNKLGRELYFSEEGECRVNHQRISWYRTKQEAVTALRCSVHKYRSSQYGFTPPPFTNPRHKRRFS